MATFISSLRLLCAVAVLASLFVVGAPQIARAHTSEQFVMLKDTKGLPGGGDRNGKGRATLKTASEISTICYDISFKRIGRVTAAHIHDGRKGEGGPKAVTLFNSKRGRSSAARGCKKNVSPAAIEAIQSHPKAYYLDVHTKGHPKGALRGQLSNVEGSYRPPAMCAKQSPAMPNTESQQASKVRKAKVISLTDAATKRFPVKRRHTFSEALWAEAGPTPIVEDTKFYVFQVDTAGIERGLFVKVGWSDPSATEIDLFAYEDTGLRVAHADEESPEKTATAGESIHVSGRRCEVFAIEVRPTQTVGEKVTVEAWLDEPHDHSH